MVPRDVDRYYAIFAGIAKAQKIDFRTEVLSGMVPAFNAMQLLLARGLRLPPQSLSLVSVAGTMFFFSLGFSRFARRNGVRTADEIILWALSFLLAFNLSQTGELLKQYLAASLFFYAYALLADGSPFCLLPLLASLGTQNSAFMFLLLLPLARVSPKKRTFLWLAFAAIAVGMLGPYEIVSWVGARIPGLQFLGQKAQTYASLTSSATPRRNYYVLFFYLAMALLLSLDRPKEKRAKISPLGGLCVGYCLLSLAGLRTSILAERLIGGGSAIYGAFLLWSAGRLEEPQGRTLLWLQVSFLLVSTALLYNVALGSFGYYSFDLMGGDWRSLLGASVFDLLRFKAAW
jgi:hypothetical protein